jgi:syntaxin-binding protein 1
MRFADAEMPLECKVRLLALFLITQDGIKEEWRKKLVDIAKIDSSSESALGNLRLLGINTLVDKPNVKRSTFKPSSKESDFVLSRFTPLVKDMLVGEFERTLTTEDYPYIVEPPPKATTNKKGPLGMSSSKPNMAAESKSANNSAASVGTAQSRRTKKPGPAVATNNWAAKPTADDKPKAKEPDGPRVILFIAGGMTYSEMRVAAEVEKEYGAEILIGSTHIITPKIFMEDLKKLDPEIKLDI